MVVTDNWCVYFVVASAVCQPYRIHDSQEACHDGLTLDGVMTIYDASRLNTRRAHFSRVGVKQPCS
jgi:hypothetical protein